MIKISGVENCVFGVCLTFVPIHVSQSLLKNGYL